MIRYCSWDFRIRYRSCLIRISYCSWGIGIRYRSFDIGIDLSLKGKKNLYWGINLDK